LNAERPKLCGDGLPSWSFLVNCSTPPFIMASPSMIMLFVSFSNSGKLRENVDDLTLVINKMKTTKRFWLARSIVLKLAMVVMMHRVKG
jgi:hypothetical protein